MNRPLRLGMYAAIVYVQIMFNLRIYDIYPRTPTFTPRAPTVGGRFIVPAYHGIYGVDNRVQPMFYPRAPIVIRGYNLHNSVRTGAMNRPLRLRNVCCVLFTHTNVYPRASTVGADLSCPHITEYMLWVFLCFINFVFHLCHSICALMIFLFRSVAPTHVAATLN